MLSSEFTSPDRPAYAIHAPSGEIDGSLSGAGVWSSRSSLPSASESVAMLMSSNVIALMSPST